MIIISDSKLKIQESRVINILIIQILVELAVFLVYEKRGQICTVIVVYFLLIRVRRPSMMTLVSSRHLVWTTVHKILEAPLNPPPEISEIFFWK